MRNLVIRFTGSKYVVFGTIRESETGQGIPGLRVEAFDRDILLDDPLGVGITGPEGGFRIPYLEKDFRDSYFDKKPDLYLEVFDRKGRKVYSSKRRVRRSSDHMEEFTILLQAGRISDRIQA